jgi:hypothetical protein
MQVFGEDILAAKKRKRKEVMILPFAIVARQAYSASYPEFMFAVMRMAVAASIHAHDMHNWTIESIK